MRHVRMLGPCLVAVFAFAAIGTTSASAAIKNPTKSRKIFENCNLHGLAEERWPVVDCTVGATENKEGGQFTVGPVTVPIVKQIVLQYGLAVNEETGEVPAVAPTHGVEFITPAPEKVPGEPIAHISVAEQEELGWPETLQHSYKLAQKNGSVKKVDETIEAAGLPYTNALNLIEEEHTAVEASVKIKGENKWIAQLGDVCYIGSDAEPIVQHLTTGASTSPLTGETIHGSAGEIEETDNGTELVLAHSDLVRQHLCGAGCGVHGTVRVGHLRDARQVVRDPGGRWHNGDKGDTVPNGRRSPRGTGVLTVSLG